MTDDLFAKLKADALRRAPRLDPVWGHCPSCELGATGACNFAFVYWSYCEPCRVRWLSPSGAPDLAEVDEDVEQILALELAGCVELDHTPGIGPEETGESQPMRNQETKKTYGIDPHAFLGPRDVRVLRGLTKDQRIRVTDHVLHDLRQFPPTRKNRTTGRPITEGGHMWHRIRRCVVDDMGRTVDQALSIPEIAAPSFALAAVGDLLLHLVERRAEIETQLRQLDAIAEAFASSELEPAGR